MYWPLIDLIAGLFYTDIKIIRNIVSFSHAVSSCILYTVNRDLMMINSLAYFAWDTLYILEQKNMDWMLFWHHIISNYLLLVQAPNYIKERILFTLELSNLPTYVVYHMLKLKKDVRLVRMFQFIWSCYFRIYIMTSIIINNILHHHDPDFTILLVCLIYVIGINFNICILKQIIR